MQREKGMKSKIVVDGREIAIQQVNNSEYISLTDMVRNYESPSDIIQAWMRTRATVEFLGVWERMNNPDFNHPDFEVIRNEAGSNTFTLSVKKWKEAVNGIGLNSRAGRYGGTYAHVDIAFSFGAYISATFQYLLIREFQRLKTDEADRLQQGWDYRRFLAKVNYPLQTEAIKESIIPRLAKSEHGLAYATEADIINIALFGCTAKQWREANPDLAGKGNLRDYASALELTVLSNLESFNSQLIRKGAGKESRLEALMDMARFQLGVFSRDDRLRIDDK